VSTVAAGVVRARRAAATVHWTWLLLAASVVFGIAVRAWILSSPLGVLESDEAVVGLMARHALHGEFHVFYWLSLYGGTQEALATAAVFAVTGSSVLVLKLVPLATFAVAGVLTWRVGLRTVGANGARIGAALFSIWPAYFVWWTTKARAYYATGLLCELVALLFVLRLRERDSRVDAVVLGFTLGFGTWATEQSLLIPLPALAWLAWRRAAAFRLAPYAIVGAVVGAAPWLAWNAAHGGDAVFPPSVAGAHSTYGSRFWELFATVLPTWLGLRLPYSLDWLFPRAIGVALLVLALGAFAYAVVRRRRDTEPLLVVALLFPFLYAATPFTYFRAEPRYLVFLAPIPALLLGRAITRRAATAAAALALAAALSLYGLVRFERQGLYRSLAQDVRVPDDMQPLIRTLEREHATRVLANYWIAYRLDFESRERITATSTGFVRYEPYDRKVRRSAYPARVYVQGSRVERRARPALLRRGYRALSAGGFVAYVHP
jgi:hypothetical protein